MQNYIYSYQSHGAKAAYHLRMEEIITSEIDNETDPTYRKRLIARRSHHRRLYRKYRAKSVQAWVNMEVIK